ncbi:MAG: cytidine deaminase, partial [Bacteroidetes bacterium]|nr:cytidine deaminase [Bacteroidota bacterium]
CNECAKAIIQSGIQQVIYLSDKYADSDASRASRRMLETAGITCRKVETKISEIILSFTDVNI